MAAAKLSLDKLPVNAVRLFDLLWRDAPNWSGMPLLGGNVGLLGEKEDRGLLSYLKRAGLVVTFTDEGNTWVEFTEAGKAFGARGQIDDELTRGDQ